MSSKSAAATQELGAGASCSERTALRRRSDESERPREREHGSDVWRAERERLEGGGRAVGERLPSYTVSYTAPLGRCTQRGGGGPLGGDLSPTHQSERRADNGV